MDADRLLFVYNVDASPVALLRDLYSGLKTGTTDCHLCDLTFGRLMKDRTWVQFVERLPYDVDFQLRSTFTRRHPEVDATTFPAAFLEHRDGSLECALTAGEINAAADLDDLRTMVSDLVARLERAR